MYVCIYNFFFCFEIKSFTGTFHVENLTSPVTPRHAVRHRHRLYIRAYTKFEFGRLSYRRRRRRRGSIRCVVFRTTLASAERFDFEFYFFSPFTFLKLKKKKKFLSRPRDNDNASLHTRSRTINPNRYVTLRVDIRLLSPKKKKREIHTHRLSFVA